VSEPPEREAAGELSVDPQPGARGHEIERRGGRQLRWREGFQPIELGLGRRIAKPVENRPQRPVIRSPRKGRRARQKRSGGGGSEEFAPVHGSTVAIAAGPAGISRRLPANIISPAAPHC
jgi:hypothetical protein